ncbi:MAG: secondary thiamine-phosphate synthase enzyme YjbQ [Hyphomicrobiaceae bacterium]|nr:secondary thiamine-phosphate synthase enzyme YjbQ [Hyphomicrobiaceae bacterium]
MQLRQNLHNIEVSTTGKGFFEINRQLATWLDDIKAGDGLLTLFIAHTSASLTIQENADHTVALDLMDALDGLAPQKPDYRHDSEGPDDMPSHIKGLLTQTQVAIPIIEGQMVLGTWQGIFVIEHRTSPHNRKLALHYSGT